MRLIRLLIAESPGAFIGAVLAGTGGGVLFTGAVATVARLLEADAWRQFAAVSTWGPYLAGVAVVAGLTFLSGHGMYRLMQRHIAGLRLSLCRQVRNAGLEHLETVGEARILAVLSDDLMRLAQGAFALPIAVVNGAICLAALVYIAALSPLLCGVIVAVQGASLLCMWRLLARFQHLLARAATARQDLMRHFHLLVSSIKELKQSDRKWRAFYDGLYRPNIGAVRAFADDVNRVSVAMDTFAKASFLLSIGCVFYVVSHVAPSVPADTMRAVILAYIFMVTPLAAVLNQIAPMSDANVALRNVERFELEAEPHAAQPEPHGPVPVTLALQGVTYRYPGAPAGVDIGPLDLHVRRGEIVALAGANGSGKTTAAKLFAGLYRPAGGACRHDGRHIVDAGWQRAQIACLWAENAQDVCFLDGEAGALDAGRDMWTALGLDALRAFATGWIDCRGMSVGQRRRVALVGLVLENKPFLVIDEWAANQDRRSKTVFYSRILPQLRERGHGILLIAHDDDIYRCADRIVEMRDGKLLNTDVEEATA
jgi:putative pyoverdin transport system ATP-binding/permease protein